MNLSAGILKLERIITAKRSLEKKLKTMPDNQVIKDTIKKHEDTIAYLKDKLDFNNRFEVPKACTCPPIKLKEVLEETVEAEKKNNNKLERYESECATLQKELDERKKLRESKSKKKGRKKKNEKTS